MRRREFITLIGGAAIAWPIGSRAQQPEPMRRIGVLLGAGSTDDRETQPRLSAFLQTLQQFGWIEGRNLRVDVRRGAGNADDVRKYAAELVALTPDVIFATGAIFRAVVATNP